MKGKSGQDGELTNDFSRRKFIQAVSSLAAAMAMPAGFLSLAGCSSDPLGHVLPRRRLGKTGMMITTWGLGGAHVNRLEEKLQEESVELCIAKGVRFFDTAYAYGRGESETLYGKFLTPKYRDHVKIMSKTDATNAEGVREQLEGGLRRMKTDYMDLYMIHSIESVEDVEERLKNGVLDELLKAKDEGKIKHIGFTGHRDYRAHLHLLSKEIPELEATMMPVNVADPSYESFIVNVIPELIRRDIGILAMKTLASAGLMGGTRGGTAGDPVGTHPSVIPELVSVREAHRFVLSLPVAGVVSGANDLEQLAYNLETAENFIPMEDEERARLINACEDLGSTGEMEPYKWPGFEPVRTRFRNS